MSSTSGFRLPSMRFRMRKDGGAGWWTSVLVTSMSLSVSESDSKSSFLRVLRSVGCSGNSEGSSESVEFCSADMVTVMSGDFA